MTDINAPPPKQAAQVRDRSDPFDISELISSISSVKVNKDQQQGTVLEDDDGTLTAYNNQLYHIRKVRAENNKKDALVASLKDRIYALQLEMQDAAQQSSEVQSIMLNRINEMEKSLFDQFQSMQEMEATSKDRIEERDALKMEVAHLKEAAIEAESQLASYRAAAEEVEREKAASAKLEALVASLNAKLENKDTAATGYTEKLKFNLAAAHDTITDMAARIVTTENTRQKLELSLLDSSKDLEALRNDYADVRAELENWKQMYSDLEDVVNAQKLQSSSSAQGYNQVQHDLSKQLESCKKETAGYKRELHNFTEVCSMMARELSMLELSFVDQPTSIQKLQHQQADVIAAARIIKQSAHAFMNNDYSSTEGISTRSSLSKMVDFICETLCKISQYQEQTGVLNAELERKSSAIDSANTIFEQLEAKISHSRHELDALDHIYSEVSKKLENALRHATVVAGAGDLVEWGGDDNDDDDNDNGFSAYSSVGRGREDNRTAASIKTQAFVHQVMMKHPLSSKRRQKACKRFVSLVSNAVEVSKSAAANTKAHKELIHDLYLQHERKMQALQKEGDSGAEAVRIAQVEARKENDQLREELQKQLSAVVQRQERELEKVETERVYCVQQYQTCVLSLEHALTYTANLLTKYDDLVSAYKVMTRICDGYQIMRHDVNVLAKDCSTVPRSRVMPSEGSDYGDDSDEAALYIYRAHDDLNEFQRNSRYPVRSLRAVALYVLAAVRLRNLGKERRSHPHNCFAYRGSSFGGVSTVVQGREAMSAAEVAPTIDIPLLYELQKDSPEVVTKRLLRSVHIRNIELWPASQHRRKASSSLYASHLPLLSVVKANTNTSSMEKELFGQQQLNVLLQTLSDMSAAIHLLKEHEYQYDHVLGAPKLTSESESPPRNSGGNRHTLGPQSAGLSTGELLRQQSRNGVRITDDFTLKEHFFADYSNRSSAEQKGEHSLPLSPVYEPPPSVKPARHVLPASPSARSGSSSRLSQRDKEQFEADWQSDQAIARMASSFVTGNNVARKGSSDDGFDPAASYKSIALSSTPDNLTASNHSPIRSKHRGIATDRDTTLPLERSALSARVVASASEHYSGANADRDKHSSSYKEYVLVDDEEEEEKDDDDGDDDPHYMLEDSNMLNMSGFTQNSVIGTVNNDEADVDRPSYMVNSSAGGSHHAGHYRAASSSSVGAPPPASSVSSAVVATSAYRPPSSSSSPSRSYTTRSAVNLLTSERQTAVRSSGTSNGAASSRNSVSFNTAHDDTMSNASASSVRSSRTAGEDSYFSGIEAAAAGAAGTLHNINNINTSPSRSTPTSSVMSNYIRISDRARELNDSKDGAMLDIFADIGKLTSKLETRLQQRSNNSSPAK